MISNLAQIHDLDVIARTSVMRYKGTTKTVPEIGRELGVDAIVDRIGAARRWRGPDHGQLIRASTDTHLWASEYERDAADVLKLEAEVARTIAQEIQAHLTPEEARRLASARSINPDAREAFLLGRYHRRQKQSKRTQGRRSGTSSEPFSFNRTTRRRMQGSRRHRGGLRHKGFTQRRRADANRRGEGDRARPGPREAHAAMALIKFADWDWAGAEQEARRALALNPERQSFSRTLLNITGRHAEAIAVSEHAVRVDPLSSAAHYNHGTDLILRAQV